MNTLVIGGTRFMGIAVVERLLERGHTVTTFNRGTRKISWPTPVRELIGDRTDHSALAQLKGETFEAIVDFCAYVAADVEGLLAVQGDAPHLVHISSGTVYELQPRLPWPEETPYGPAALWGRYAEGKIECERLLRARRADSTATTAIRLPWVLGPRSYADREAFVLNRLLDGEEILVPGDGEALQQFVSAQQVAHSLVAALEMQQGGGWRAFNIASPQYTSLQGFIQICAAVANVSPRYRCVGGGPTGTRSAVFDMSNAVFPFPNENYLLDVNASVAAGIAPPATLLDTMIEEALEALLSDPARRSWRRTPAELIVLESP